MMANYFNFAQCSAIVFLFLLLRLNEVAAATRPKLIGSPRRYVPAALGSTVRLQCSVLLDAGPALLYKWSVRLANRQSFEPLSRLPDLRLSGGDERTMQLVEVEADDSGIYKCEATSGANGASEPITFELIVYDPRVVSTNATLDPRRCMPPRWLEPETRKSEVVVKEGEDATLGCRAFGYPDPRVHWFHNNQRQDIFTDQFELTLEKVQLAQRGSWSCLVTNDCSQAGDARFQINYQLVISKMDIRLSANVTAMSGKAADLECNVKSSVAVTISWLRQGNARGLEGSGSVPAMLALERGGQYHVLHDQHEFTPDEAAARAAAAGANDGRFSIVGFVRHAEPDNVYVSRLHIERAQPADQGEYLCVAQSHKLASHLINSATTLRVIVDPDANRLATFPRQPATPSRPDEPEGSQRNVHSTGLRSRSDSSSDAADKPSHHIIVLLIVLPTIAVLAVAATITILCCLRKPHYTKLFGRAATGRLVAKPRHANGAARRADSNSAAWSSAQGSNSVRLLPSDARSLSVAGSGSGAPVVVPTSAAAWCNGEQGIPPSSLPTLQLQSNHQMYNPLLAASGTSCAAPNLFSASSAIYPPGHINLYSTAAPMIYASSPQQASYIPVCATPTTYYGQNVMPHMTLANGLGAGAGPDLSDNVDSVSAGDTTQSSSQGMSPPPLPLPLSLPLPAPQQTQSATSFDMLQQQQQRPHGRRHAKHAARANANMAAVAVTAAGRAQSGSERSASTFGLQQQQQHSSPSSSRQLVAPLPPGTNKSNSRINVSNNLPAASYQFTAAAPVANVNPHALYPHAQAAFMPMPMSVPLSIGQMPPVSLSPITYQSPLQMVQSHGDLPPTSPSDAAYSNIDVDSPYALRAGQL